MTTTRHSFTSIATALAMAAALIAAMGPRVEAVESDLEYEIEVEWYCEDVFDPDWDPYLVWDPEQLNDAGNVMVDVDPNDEESVVSNTDIYYGWETGVDEDCEDIQPGGSVEVTLVSVKLLDSFGEPVETQPDAGDLPSAGAGFDESIAIWSGDPAERLGDSLISISVPPSAAEGTYAVRIKVEWTP